MNHVVRFR